MLPVGLTAVLAAGGTVATVAGGLKWAVLVWSLASRGSDPEHRTSALVVE
jgi:hypothetical protein